MDTKKNFGRINARIDPELKAEGDAVLSELGYTPSTLITVLYKTIVRNKAIPRDMTMLDPLDVATAKAHAEIENGDYDEFDNVDDWYKDLTDNES
ncbi:type II toxin-antitoxin system RelB/DinJ family antitoxin [Lacticaseibacillus hulanensis]|uniref:type II toxin-antitoxin system RelB/DinJ family antitoxin n=1 Tax=Lacticaseibacillus hulanensis TaxID=2493111 RepID=UPI000FD710C6|nr:type II toxin-antitoxin system RelB/DinJ family antitoxin [Lacticaseibacillus hulanensis]